MRGERIDITCQGCGNSFSWLKSQKMRKHCSQACKNARAERVEIICPGCDALWATLKSQSQGRTYCSGACKAAHTKRRRQRVCQNCGDEFLAPKPTVKQTFCSVNCRAAQWTPPKQVDGRTRHPHYDRWYNMMCRCQNPNHPQYHHYGGRGISVCEEWRTPANFYRYLDEVLGPCPNTYSLDRIDNDGDYEPDNVRWSSKLEQFRNRRPFMVDPRGRLK